MAEIFVIKDGETLVSLTQQPYESEDLLQTLLAKYPSLLAGDQIRPDSPRRWLLIRREMNVPGEESGAGRWSLDHLFLDQEGVPTLVEVKRSSDTRIRREVVGQMLDYAANAVKYWPVESIRHTFEEACGANGTDPAGAMAELIGPEGDPDQFWTSVKTNLQAGRIRMLFVADEIPEELRRVVEFLNEQMDPAEVLAVEIRQFAGQSLKTLVPRVIGQTAEAESRKSSSTGPKRQWDEPTFFAEMAARNGPELAEVARKLLAWARARGTRIWWGRGAQNGSFVPVLELADADHEPFAVYTGGPRGRAVVEMYFYWYAFKPPFDDRGKRLEMLKKLNAIPGVSLPEDGVDRRPSIPLTSLAHESALAKFLAVMDWYLGEVRKAAT